MTTVRARGEDVRRFILDNVAQHPTDITKLTAEKFGTSRQAVSKHLARLVSENCLVAKGATRNKVYRLAPLSTWRHTFPITNDLSEGDVWTQFIKVALGKLPDNVMNIWHYGFTEMFNNAIDHSEGKTITVDVTKTAADTAMAIMDDGVGIFSKIQKALNLPDPRHAVLELAKGKLTTDPTRHTGEGIFFTSRLFDFFAILSTGVHFSHTFEVAEDWILERPQTVGTAVFMEINNHTARRVKAIFGQFSSGDDYGFTKTVVPVKLAQYGNDQLVSRSQAKRVLSRIDLFQVVIFDFENVADVGPAFADEIFRVFASEHPDITLTAVRTSPEVEKMVNRACALLALQKAGQKAG